MPTIPHPKKCSHADGESSTYRSQRDMIAKPVRANAKLTLFVNGDSPGGTGSWQSYVRRRPAEQLLIVGWQRCASKLETTDRTRIVNLFVPTRYIPQGWQDGRRQYNILPLRAAP